METRDEDLHARLDEMARRAETTIRDGRDLLDALDFEEGRSLRAAELDRFMRAFGGT